MAFTYTTRKDGRLVKKVTYNGKSIYLYSNDKNDLYNQYINLKYKIQSNKTLNKSSIYFKNYAEEWFELNISNKEIATQNSVRNRIKHINQYIGNLKLSNIKPNDIQRMVTEMEKQGYKDVTNRTLMECKRILENAVQNDYIEKNPASNIRKIKYQKNERKTLTIEEDKKVIELALKHKYGLFILLIRFCGLRPEECVALTLNDINIKNKTISINKAVSLAQNQPQLKSTKNLKNRILPIPDFLIDNLKQHIANQHENGSYFVFTKETDKLSMLTKQALKTHLNSFLNELNKDTKNKIEFSYYVLRHSYCTMLYYADIKIKEAQRLMGHSSAKMVYDIYTHLDEQREDSAKSINNYIKSTY
jgi:integrase